jgi:NTE family protein
VTIPVEFEIPIDGCCDWGVTMQAGRFKTALVLSGGSARALAHLGVLLAIEKSSIGVDLIVGTSMGALVGGLYAHHGDAQVVSRTIRDFLEHPLFREALSLATENAQEDADSGFFQRFAAYIRHGVFCSRSLNHSSLISQDLFADVLEEIVPDFALANLSIPFAAGAMDLGTGQEVVLRSGSLRQVVGASIAIPGVLPAVSWEGQSLVDGSWLDNVPVTPAIALGAHFVLAVDAAWEISSLWNAPRSAVEIAFRSNEITRITLNQQRRALADVLLVPEVGQVRWADFQAIDRCKAAGSSVILDNLGQIRRTRFRRRLLSLGGRLHPARSAAWRRPLVIH